MTRARQVIKYGQIGSPPGCTAITGRPADLAGHWCVGSPRDIGGGALLPILRLPGQHTPPVRPCDETRALFGYPEGRHFGVRPSTGRLTDASRSFPPARLRHPQEALPALWTAGLALLESQLAEPRVSTACSHTFSFGYQPALHWMEKR